MLTTSVNHIYIDGSLINSELDFHKAISMVLNFGPCYGNNLDALWDMLSSGAACGVILHWDKSSASKEKLGQTFDVIVHLFDEAKALDIKLGLSEKFDFVLE